MRSASMPGYRSAKTSARPGLPRHVGHRRDGVRHAGEAEVAKEYHRGVVVAVDQVAPRPRSRRRSPSCRRRPGRARAPPRSSPRPRRPCSAARGDVDHLRLGRPDRVRDPGLEAPGESCADPDRRHAERQGGVRVRLPERDDARRRGLDGRGGSAPLMVTGTRRRRSSRPRRPRRHRRMPRARGPRRGGRPGAGPGGRNAVSSLGWASRTPQHTAYRTPVCGPANP